jgi:phospholipase C
MNHSSVTATLEKKYRLEPLTQRDAVAPTIDNAITLTRPRQPATWPQTHPQWVPPNPEAGPPVSGLDGERPLGPPGVGLLGMLIAHYGGDETRVPRTYREAHELIEVSGKGLFGTGPSPAEPLLPPLTPAPTPPSTSG